MLQTLWVSFKGDKSGGVARRLLWVPEPDEVLGDRILAAAKNLYPQDAVTNLDQLDVRVFEAEENKKGDLVRKKKNDVVERLSN